MFKLTLTKLATSSTLRDSGLSFVGQFSAAVLGAAFFALLFRWLGPADFGLFSLAYGTAIIVKDFIDLGTMSSLLRFLPGTSDQTKQASLNYLFLILVSYYAVVSPILLLFTRPASLLLFGQVVLGLIPLMILTAISLSLSSFLAGVMRAERKFGWEAGFSLTQPLLRLIFLFGLFGLGQLSVITTLVITIVSYSITALTAWFVLRINIQLSLNQPKHISQPINNFMASVVFSGVTGTITDRVNLYITNNLINIASVGILSAYNQLMRPVVQFVGSIDSVLGSRFAQFQTKAEAVTYLLKAMTLALFLGAGLLSTIAFMKPIVVLLFGAEVEPYYHLYPVLAFGFSFYVIQGPIGAYLLYYKGRADALAIISLVQLVITIMANWYLISRYQLVGAAWAFVVIFASLLLLKTIFAFILPTKPKSILK